jgi:hypothetical protein
MIGQIDCVGSQTVMLGHRVKGRQHLLGVAAQSVQGDRRGAIGRSEDGDVHCSAATDANADVLHQTPAAVLGWRIGMAGGGGDKGRGSPDIIETWFVDADANGWARRKFPAESRP